MRSVIFEETTIERRTADAVRHEVSRRIGDREWSVDFVAERLGLVPVGVDAVLGRTWTFEEAFRIATAVGMDFGGMLARSTQA